MLVGSTTGETCTALGSVAQTDWNFTHTHTHTGAKSIERVYLLQVRHGLEAIEVLKVEGQGGRQGAVVIALATVAIALPVTCELAGGISWSLSATANQNLLPTEATKGNSKDRLRSGPGCLPHRPTERRTIQRGTGSLLRSPRRPALRL